MQEGSRILVQRRADDDSQRQHLRIGNALSQPEQRPFERKKVKTSVQDALRKKEQHTRGGLADALSGVPCVP